jgi:lauroyl/myristoyl acyltransferase
MRERLVPKLYVLGWKLVAALPEALAYALFALIADVVWWRHGRGVQRLESNLRRAAPGADADALRKLSRLGMRSYLRYWCDCFRLPGWSPERLISTCRIEGEDVVNRVFGQGHGVVAALAHQGNWDHAGAWSTVQVAKVTTVAERLEPAELFDRFMAFREGLGMEVLALTGAGNVLGRLIQRAKAGGFVPLLADRDLTEHGIRVNFLGESARVAAGPAAIALAAKVPLLPINTYYERLPPGSAARWGLVLQIHPPVPVPVSAPGGATLRRGEQIAAMMQACADALSAGIRQHPQDWHMLQRVFEADLGVEAPANE